MLQILRLLITSGALLSIGSGAVKAFSRYSDARLLTSSAVALLTGWVVTIADGFLPVMAVPPVGLIAFLLAMIVGIGSNVIVLMFAITVLYRAARATPDSRIHSGLATLAGLLALLAVLSFVGQRVLSLILATTGN